MWPLLEVYFDRTLTPQKSVSESSLQIPHVGRFIFFFFPVIHRSLKVRKYTRTAAASSTPIRCGQSTREGSSLDIWRDRLAMVGFAAAISVEIATGKGLLEVYPQLKISY